MNSSKKQVFMFGDRGLFFIRKNREIWFCDYDLAHALGISSEKEINEIYSHNRCEFSSLMSRVTMDVTPLGEIKSIRLFSPLGAYVISLFAKTKESKVVRRCILNIIEKEGYQTKKRKNNFPIPVMCPLCGSDASICSINRISRYNLEVYAVCLNYQCSPQTFKLNILFVNYIDD